MNLARNLQLIFKLRQPYLSAFLNNQLFETARNRQIPGNLDQFAAAIWSQKLARRLDVVEGDVFQIHRDPL